MSADEISDQQATGNAAEAFSGSLEGEAWDEEAAPRERHTARVVVSAIILVVVVILVLLLLRECSSSGTSVISGRRTIVPVPAQVRQENVISVWIKPNQQLRAIMVSAGVRATSTRYMGEGLYFVFLPDGEDAVAATKRLKADSRVYDAGFAYDDAKTSSPTLP